MIEYQEEENAAKSSPLRKDKNMALKDQALKMLENRYTELLKGDTLNNTKKLSTQSSSHGHSSLKRSDSELNEQSLNDCSGSVLRNETSSTQPNQEILRKEDESKSNLRRERAVRKYQKAVVVIQKAVRKFIKNRRRKKRISNSPAPSKKPLSDVQLRKESISTPKKGSFTDKNTFQSGIFLEFSMGDERLYSCLLRF